MALRLTKNRPIMAVCCVENCGVTADTDVLLFQFPASRSLRRRWFDAINSSSRLDNDSHICIKHFTLDDYEEVRGKTRLKRRVVPSVFRDQKLKENVNEEDSVTKKKSENDESNGDKSDNKDPHNSSSNKNISPSEKEEKTSHNDSEEGNNRQEIQTSQKEKETDEPLDNGNINQNTQEGERKSDTEDEKSRKSDNHDGNEKSTNGHKKSVKDITPDNHNEKSENECGNNKNTDNKRRNSSEEANDQRKKLTVAKIQRSTSSDSCISPRNVKSPVPMSHDIEDLLTNYHIENKKTERQMAAMAEELTSKEVEKPPAYVEMNVGQSAGSQAPPSNDVLMLLEDVQVEVDPNLLLADEDCVEQIDLDDDDDDNNKKKSRNHKEAISLLTSSDDDDVIIQEPHIDTVVVSDETDEDELPLVQFSQMQSKPKKKVGKKEKKNKKKQEIEKIMWGGQNYYVNRVEYKKHLETHSKVIQICQDCGFTTCSKSQLYRHRRKHKNEKKHKCPLCNYSARHNMSLIYHLKTHENMEKEVFSCDTCEFVTPVKSDAVSHRQSCVFRKTSRYPCVLCEYTSKRRSDLYRHVDTVHKGTDSTDEDA